MKRPQRPSAGRPLSKEWRALVKARREEYQRTTKDHHYILGILAAFSFVSGVDGRISEKEIAFALAYLTKTLDISTIKECGDPYKLIHSSEEKNLRNIRSFAFFCRPSAPHRRRLVEALLECAECDGIVIDSEIEAIKRICALLEISIVIQEQIFQRWYAQRRAHSKERPDKNWRNKDRRSNTGGFQSEAVAPAWCYDLLACKPEDSEEHIKRQYRGLAMQLHPDKHTAKLGGSVEYLKQTKEFQRMKEAYDEIRRTFGLKRQVG